jgi:lysine N6-hydroxylase
MTDPVPHYHTVGIGAGPANLSLAALFEAVVPHRMALFERRTTASWHDQLIHPGVTMQTSWVKDLVSLVDPRHRLTFLNYMVSTGRVYALLNAQYDLLPRLEYVHYLQWASAQIEDVHYGVEVDRVAFDGRFRLFGGGRELASSDHLVLGMGDAPRVPPGFTGVLGEGVFLADELGERLERDHHDLCSRVAVVGGGQTGAECVLALLGRGFRDVRWFGRRPWFAPMDDSPPANDHYRPAYQGFLHEVPPERRRHLVEGQRLTGDAITPNSLRTIYQANYEGMLRNGDFPLTLLPGRVVQSAEIRGDRLTLQVSTAEGPQEHQADYVVLAAGREPSPLPFDRTLLDLLETDAAGEPIVGTDYSVRWRGPDDHRIYAQNRARFTHGVPDANLTLLPVRAATIINSMFGRTVWEYRDDYISTDWA